jgi:nitronate monooxygenase
MIVTALTEMFGLQHPIVLGPMGGVSGGHLAATVSNAGGLGLVGGGYGDPAWLRTELALVTAETQQPWGVGLITWSIDQSVFDLALSYRPDAFMLSFGDPRPYAPAIKSAGSKLICQVQDLAETRLAQEAGADIIVAQGTEAGGHGARRATLPLVPAVVDAVAPTPVLAAGGIADGRGLAAALMLGAHGALIGTRFYASTEALGQDRAKLRSLRAATRLRAHACSTSSAVTCGRRHTPGAHFATVSWSAGMAARTIWRPHWKPNAPRIKRLPVRAITIRR